MGAEDAVIRGVTRVRVGEAVEGVVEGVVEEERSEAIASAAGAVAADRSTDTGLNE